MNTTTVPDQESQAHEQIERLRLAIDECDEGIVRHLAQRHALVKAIGEIKRNANLSVHDPARESSQFSRYVHIAKLNHVSPEQVIAPFRTIINLSKQAQYDTQMVNTEPIVPKFCLPCGWRTCGVEVPESDVRVCPACRSPLF